MFKFPDNESLKFYKKCIRNLDGPVESHGGYYVRGSGDPPPFRKYRAWIPGEMMDTVESIPDFLSIETGIIPPPRRYFRFRFLAK